MYLKWSQVQASGYTLQMDQVKIFDPNNSYHQVSTYYEQDAIPGVLYIHTYIHVI